MSHLSLKSNSAAVLSIKNYKSREGAMVLLQLVNFTQSIIESQYHGTLTIFPQFLKKLIRVIYNKIVFECILNRRFID